MFSEPRSYLEIQIFRKPLTEFFDKRSCKGIISVKWKEATRYKGQQSMGDRKHLSKVLVGLETKFY